MRRTTSPSTPPSPGWRGSMAVYGHFGRPVLVFPAEDGRSWDFEDSGMIEAVRWLLDAGRVKLYCIDSFDAATWSDDSLPIEERARRHDAYEGGSSTRCCRGSTTTAVATQEVATLGCSLGAFHAANIALRHADRFPLAIGLSGNYDPASWRAWGDRGDAAYFHNPMDYVAHLGGGHLDWLRSRVSVLLVCGQGQWEDTTGSLDSTKQPGRAAGPEGDPTRARPVGVRRPARLAVLAAPARPPPAAVLLDHPSRTPARAGTTHPEATVTDSTHLLGLLLGTENDWPAAFESLVRSLGPVRTQPATRTRTTSSASPSSRSTCGPSRAYDLVIDRLAYWYYHPREWLKKVALMDDVYLLNSPFTFQAMEKHAAYCAMMRLGLKVPDTVLVPYKNPLDNAKYAYTAGALQPAVRPRRGGREGRLPAVHEALRRRRLARGVADPLRRRASTVPTTSRARC